MSFYKGKMTLTEIINLPNRIFHTLYSKLMKKMSTDEGKKEVKNQKIEEEVGLDG